MREVTYSAHLVSVPCWSTHGGLPCQWLLLLMRWDVAKVMTLKPQSEVEFDVDLLELAGEIAQLEKHCKYFRLHSSMGPSLF